MSGIGGRFGVRPLVGAIVLSALAAVTVAVSVAPVGAQTAPGAPTFANCNVTTYRFLFWPQGHKAVKSQQFPAYPIPHTELFTGTGKTYTAEQNLGLVDATGTSRIAPSCTVGTLTAGNAGGPIPADRLVTATKPTALSCSIPSSSVLIVPNAQGKAVLSVVIPGESPAYASMTPTGSELTYDKTMCTPGKVPKK